MYSPTPPMVVNERSRPRETPPKRNCGLSLRRFLLLWAYLRLAYSLFWSGVIIISTIQDYRFYDNILRNDPLMLLFGAVALMIQLVEITMFIMFIVACHKKCRKLLNVYFFYCIVTLITYFIVTALFVSVEHENAHFLVEIYMVYHTMDFSYLPIEYDGIIYIVGAFVDICLQILLIYLLKKLIAKYSCRDDDNCRSGKNVYLKTGEEVPTNV